MNQTWDSLIRSRMKPPGLFLSQSYWFKEGLSGAVKLRIALGKKLLVMDTRNIGFEDDAELYSNLAEIDALTALGDYSIENVHSTAALLRGKVLFYVDGVNPDFDRRYSLDEKVGFAKEVKRCECKGIIAAIQRPNSIKRIREVLGRPFTIVGVNGDSRSVGFGIDDGADYEVVASSYWP